MSEDDDNPESNTSAINDARSDGEVTDSDEGSEEDEEEDLVELDMESDARKSKTTFEDLDMADNDEQYGWVTKALATRLTSAFSIP